MERATAADAAKEPRSAVREGNARAPAPSGFTNTQHALHAIPRPSALPRSPRLGRNSTGPDQQEDRLGNRSSSRQADQNRTSLPPEFTRGPFSSGSRGPSDDRLHELLVETLTSEKPLYSLNPGAVRAMLESIDRSRSGVIEASEFRHAMELGVGLSDGQIERLVDALSVSPDLGGAGWKAQAVVRYEELLRALGSGSPTVSTQRASGQARPETQVRAVADSLQHGGDEFVMRRTSATHTEAQREREAQRGTERDREAHRSQSSTITRASASVNQRGA